MRFLLSFFLASVFLLNIQGLNAQSCNEPTNVYLQIPFDGAPSTLHWSYNQDCPILYFEIEYGYSPFTPGIGVGTSISPVPVNPTFYTLGYEVSVAWIRAVCDTGCAGNIGDDDLYSSDWVGAEVDITAPSQLQEGSFCETATHQTVLSFEECEYQETYIYEDYIFYDQFSEFADPSPQNIPCSEEGVFMVYQKFTATDAGIVEISVEENDESDFGLIVYDGPCNEGEVIDCTESFTNPHTLENLTPGEEYYVGFWQNGYTPYFYHGGNWVDLNYFFLTTKICEPGCGNFTITAGPNATIACGDSLPEPEYSVEGNWCSGYDVSIESTNETECGATITRTYTATDSLGNSVSDIQQFVITDDEAPMVISVPEDLSLTCEEEWNSEMPEFSDNCSVELEITYARDTLFNDGCEMLIEEIWQATDECENTTTATRSITIQDETPPSITCPDDIEIVLTNEGDIYVLNDFTTGIGVADNCAESVSVSQSTDPGTELPAGEHTITLAAFDGCYSTTCEFTIEVIISTGMDNEEHQHLVLYPNPSDGMINIQRKNDSPLQVEVFDIRGKMILSELFSIQQFELDLHSAAKGTYTVRLQSATYSVEKHIIIQ